MAKSVQAPLLGLPPEVAQAIERLQAALQDREAQALLDQQRITDLERQVAAADARAGGLAAEVAALRDCVSAEEQRAGVAEREVVALRAQLAGEASQFSGYLRKDAA